MGTAATAWIMGATLGYTVYQGDQANKQAQREADKSDALAAEQKVAAEAEKKELKAQKQNVKSRKEAVRKRSASKRTTTASRAEAAPKGGTVLTGAQGVANQIGSTAKGGKTILGS